MVHNTLFKLFRKKKETPLYSGLGYLAPTYPKRCSFWRSVKAFCQAKEQLLKGRYRSNEISIVIALTQKTKGKEKEVVDQWAARILIK